MSLLPKSFKENPKSTLKWLIYESKLSFNLKINNSVIIKDPIMLFSTEYISKKLNLNLKVA